ncbi:hypothetical protein HanPSC8_Chr15g0659481 [Helianthus annuus]|nr:hypothetical protein HanPSC8_Chr15g0659481 [Helianthus annuus]
MLQKICIHLALETTYRTIKSFLAKPAIIELQQLGSWVKPRAVKRIRNLISTSRYY